MIGSRYSVYLTRFVTLLLCGLLLIGCDQQSVQGNQASRVERAHLVELHQVTEDVVKLDRIRTGTLRATVKYRLFVQEEGQIAELPGIPVIRLAAGTF